MPTHDDVLTSKIYYLPSVEEQGFMKEDEYLSDSTFILSVILFLAGAGYAVCVGGVSAGLTLLAIAGLAFGIGVLMLMAVAMIVAVGFGAYRAFEVASAALSSFFNHDDLNLAPSA